MLLLKKDNLKTKQKLLAIIYGVIAVEMLLI